MELSGYKVKIKFKKDFLAVEQTIMQPKLETLTLTMIQITDQIILLDFCLLFGATTIARYSDKEKWVYSSYGIAFDGKSTWSSGNG